jgi:transcriptional regulator with XRE-family HTH domain
MLHGEIVGNVEAEEVRQLNRRELDERMRAAGLSDRVVANAIGTTKSNLSRWRTKEACRTTNEQALRKLADLLHVDLDLLAPVTPGSLRGRFRHEATGERTALKQIRNLDHEIRRMIDEDFSNVDPATKDRLWRLIVRRADLTR